MFDDVYPACSFLAPVYFTFILFHTFKPGCYELLLLSYRRILFILCGTQTSPAGPEFLSVVMTGSSSELIIAVIRWTVFGQILLYAVVYKISFRGFVPVVIFNGLTRKPSQTPRAPSLMWLELIDFQKLLDKYAVSLYILCHVCCLTPLCCHQPFIQMTPPTAIDCCSFPELFSIKLHSFDFSDNWEFKR